MPARDTPALGTAFVIHGYGVDLETMFPWGLYLAEAGWRVVLVDLRGHGESTGERVFFGTVETNDLVQMRMELGRQGLLQSPCVAVGHSLGGAIALRWQTVDSNIVASVAFGPPAEFVPAAARLRAEYASWIPKTWVERAAEKFPATIGVSPEALDTTGALKAHRVRSFLVAGYGDAITPPEDSVKLQPFLAAGSPFLIVGPITHEALPYVFDQHAARIRDWLATFVEERAASLRLEGAAKR
jgi:pimeloyl-ACP methyl ester carboxylesterase